MERRTRVAARGLCAAVALMTPPLYGDVVERRGAEAALEGVVTSVDDAGVTIRTDSGAVHDIAWDRIRRVETEGADPALPRYMETAVDLWRARSRVERGDTALAEPLLERLFERSRGSTHATARVIAEGLLRCRIARGANATALIPALETARLERAGITTDSYADLRPILDPETALCPQLAPAWMNDRSLLTVERDLMNYEAHGDDVVATIAALYLRAVREHLARPPVPSGDSVPEPDPDVVERDRGAGFLAKLVACGDPSRDVREAARQRAERELATAPTWARGWLHFAIGVSLVRETGIGRRQQGMVELLHLPAQHRGTLPYLGGLALAWVAEVSRADGDVTTAKVVTEELTRSYPMHPVRASAEPVFIPPV